MVNKLLVLFAFFLAIAGADAQVLTLKVNLSSTIRPVTHCASGSLYGVTDSLPPDIDSLVAPLHPNVFTQPPLGGADNQHPFGAAVPVAERLDSTTGKVLITLADLLPDWPYKWPGQATWLSMVKSVVKETMASGITNVYGYQIWNEPYGTWSTSNGNFDSLCWKPTYDLIRSLDPSAKIVGPALSYYSDSRLTDFLRFCMNDNCLPDIVCWHELQGSANLTSHVIDFENLERAIGMSSIPIFIGEYCSNTKAYEGCPGTSASFIAKFEREGVQGACISWWFTALPGRLGSLLTAGNQKGGGWWFYKWYGDMTGNMVSVTPPNVNSDGIDGFACLDAGKKYASICMGGNDTGTVDVQITGIPSSFGDTVYATVQYVPWVDKDTPVSGPITVSETPYVDSTGSIVVPVDVASRLYGYRVYVTPTAVQTAVVANPATVPNRFALSQNYPNPFNPTTQIDYTIAKRSYVTLKVYNVLGEEVATLASGEEGPGKYTATFDAGKLPSGVYFYRLTAGRYTAVKKLMLVK